MKITELTTHVLGTPWRDLTFVQVHTDEGLTGVGETRMLGHTQALLGYFAEASRNHIVGSDPFEIESLVQRMKYGDYGRAGEIVMSGIGCVREGHTGSPEEIREWMSGNICRCGCYVKIVKAVQQAAADGT